jgi:hypothetical protein
MTSVKSQATADLVASESEIAWAAGVLEGEGCFTLVRNSKAKGGRSAKIVLQMNDLDVIQEVCTVFNFVGKIYRRPPRKTSKESWAWTVYKASDVAYVISEVLPWLGKRRTEKANELLDWITGKGGSCGV